MSRLVVLKLPGEKLSGIEAAEPKAKKARPKRPARRAPEDDSAKTTPKASLGAVNASLRALDTSGAPCRRWTRKPVEITSFSGYKLELPAWVGGAESSTVQHPEKAK